MENKILKNKLFLILVFSALVLFSLPRRASALAMQVTVDITSVKIPARGAVLNPVVAPPADADILEFRFGGVMGGGGYPWLAIWQDTNNTSGSTADIKNGASGTPLLLTKSNSVMNQFQKTYQGIVYNWLIAGSSAAVYFNYYPGHKYNAYIGMTGECNVSATYWCKADCSFPTDIVAGNRSCGIRDVLTKPVDTTAWNYASCDSLYCIGSGVNSKYPIYIGQNGPSDDTYFYLFLKQIY